MKLIKSVINFCFDFYKSFLISKVLEDINFSYSSLPQILENHFLRHQILFYFILFYFIFVEASATLVSLTYTLIIIYIYIFIIILKYITKIVI